MLLLAHLGLSDVSMFPGLNTNVCHSNPVGTASVERVFFTDKDNQNSVTKTHWKNKSISVNENENHNRIIRSFVTKILRIED